MGRSTGPRWPLRMAVALVVILLGLSIAPAAGAADLGSTTEPVQDTTAAVTDPVDETVETVEETVTETAETVAETTAPVEEAVSGGDSQKTSPSAGSPTEASGGGSGSGAGTESDTAGGSGPTETAPGADGSTTAPAGEGSATGAGTGSRGAPRSDAGVPSSLVGAEGGLSTPTVPTALSHELTTTSSPVLEASSFSVGDLFRAVARSGQGLTGADNPVIRVNGGQFSAALVFVLLALALVAMGKGALRMDAARIA